MTESPIRVPLVRLDKDMPLPAYEKHSDAGADLRTAVDVRIEPGERAVVGTGIALALPHGYVGLVHPRSGLAVKHGLSVVNSPGTIDAGYRGEIKIPLINTDAHHAIDLKRGDRVAQLLVQRVETAEFDVVDELPASERGTGGFGSTGGFASPADEGSAAGAAADGLAATTAKAEN
ncbi:dUTP diphosphatase [Spelaeicoccus albus]|uniref:Deoxyuridine 5'-triphosphate nucleotidohydrolase n=1 Tax=Spelaeicoccus albus TaxID=1280376 RepID=A0A7Z0D3F7_9MICO|nr:dUTP diphosphatase [Spelaeicoccus albus]NYI68162.1 dUTP pyrophosphatase [Spelaeicoccus albus]